MGKKLVLLVMLIVQILFGFCMAVNAESDIMISGVAGAKAPDVPLADTSMPDIVLDPSIAGDVNVDISTIGVPDGTKVKVQFKDEENTNAPSSEVKDGAATVPVHIEAGNAKVLYLETEPFVPVITKSASSGKLDADSSTVGLYHLENDLLDASGNANHFSYYPGWEGVNYVDGVNQNSKGIYFWATPGSYENRRVQRYIPNGSGFTSSPQQWSAEFLVKPLRDIGNQLWYPFIIQDQNLLIHTFIGMTSWGWGEYGTYSVYAWDSMGIAQSIQIPNPFEMNKWAYVSITHDGHTLKLYVNGEEKGSTILDGTKGYPWDTPGVAAGAVYNAPDWGGSQLVIDEVRISNNVRNKQEITSNTEELLGTQQFKARTLLASKDFKGLKLEDKKNKKLKIKKEIRHQTINTIAPLEGEVKPDKDTVAFFHFNGTTKDSISKQALVGDPETTSFDEGKNGNQISSVNLSGQDDLLLVNKNIFPKSAKEWTVDFFAKPNTEPLFPTGILTVNNGEIFAMVSYAKTLEEKTILSALSFDKAGKPISIGIETDFPLDRWTHLALVYKDKKLQFLINGKLYGEADLPSLYKKGDGSINVGSDGGDGIFNGQIDELRISDTARSQVELELYAKR